MRQHRSSSESARAKNSTREKHAARFETRRPALRQISIESYKNPTTFDWNYCGGDLCCATQVVSATADVESALDHSDPSCPRLPGYAIGKSPLKL